MFRILNAASLPQITLFLLTSLIVIYRWMYEYNQRQELAKRKRIENLTDSIINKPITNEAYVLEQLFQDRYGTLLDYREIKFFLRKENPSWLINQYVNAKPWLKLNDTFSFLVPRGAIHGIRLNFIIWPCNILFTLCSMSGLLGLIVCFIFIFENSGTENIILTLFFSIICFFYAWLFYFLLNSAESARRLKDITRCS